MYDEILLEHLFDSLDRDLLISFKEPFEKLINTLENLVLETRSNEYPILFEINDCKYIFQNKNMLEKAIKNLKQEYISCIKNDPILVS